MVPEAACKAKKAGGQTRKRPRDAWPFVLHMEAETGIEPTYADLQSAA